MGEFNLSCAPDILLIGANDEAGNAKHTDSRTKLSRKSRPRFSGTGEQLGIRNIVYLENRTEIINSGTRRIDDNDAKTFKQKSAAMLGTTTRACAESAARF